MDRLQFRVDAAPLPDASLRLQQFLAACDIGGDLALLEKRAKTSVTWTAGEIVVTVDPVDHLADVDRDLLVRGIENCLDMFGIRVTDRNHAYAVTLEEYVRMFARQRRHLPFEVTVQDEWRPVDQFHLILEAAGVFSQDNVVIVAEILDAFERLVWGMYPLPGDQFADIGETSVAHLDDGQISCSIDGIFAHHADWCRRMESTLANSRAGLPLARIIYES